MKAAALDNCLRRLDAMANSTYRKDFKETAIIARRVIREMATGLSEERRLKIIAARIAEAAVVRPQVVYVTKKNREYRWVRADAPTVARIPGDLVIGTYDHGADVRMIVEDLRA